MRTQPQNVEQTIARLRSTRNELAVLDVIACGEQAIPALRTVLFERDRSGLYQTRCRAVEALAALGAENALLEFLEAEHTIIDPIERLGEDAVINASALALAHVREARLVEVLLRLAQRPALTGVIGALAAVGGADAIPALIGALEEDASRLTAESALLRLGAPARAALLGAVDKKNPSAELESESSARRRRSALRLLAELGELPKAWGDLRHLVDDKDAKVAALACEVGLAAGPPAERPRVVRRLIALLGAEDWMLREEIEQCLSAHIDSAHDMIIGYLNEVSQSGHNVQTKMQIDAALRHILARSFPQQER